MISLRVTPKHRARYCDGSDEDSWDGRSSQGGVGSRNLRLRRPERPDIRQRPVGCALSHARTVRAGDPDPGATADRPGLHGRWDEVRVSNVARSADWIRFQYENQKPLQTLVGPLVQPGATFAVWHAAIALDEGQERDRHRPGRRSRRSIGSSEANRRPCRSRPIPLHDGRGARSTRPVVCHSGSRPSTPIE